MSGKVLAYMMRNSENIWKNREFSLLWQCASLIKGLRASAMVKIEKDYIEALKGLLSDTDICVYILKMGKADCLVFLYRSRELLKILKKTENRGFLAEYGYKCGEAEDEGQDLLNMEQWLSRLSGRMTKYCGEDENLEFPHEIGIFLGYPLADVKGFVEKKGCFSLLTGYWKVYSCPRAAQFTFFIYDMAEISVINEWLAGKQTEDIVIRHGQFSEKEVFGLKRPE